MNYLTFLKHAEKVTKAKHLKARPMLQGVHHTSEYVVCTDSYRLHRVALPQEHLVGKTINPKTGEELIHGNYPNTFGLVPDVNDALATVQLDVNAVIRFLKAVKAAKMTTPDSVYFILKNERVHLVADEGGFKFEYDTGQQVNEFGTTYFDYQYLLDALEWLKEYDTTCTLYWYAYNRPFVVMPNYAPHEALALILPIRKA